MEILTQLRLDRGFFVGVRNFLVGKSDEHIEEDSVTEQAHTARGQKLQEETLKRARDQRDYQRQLADRHLKEAREVEENTKSALNAAYQELSASRYQLAQAKSNIDKTKNDLVLLSKKAMDLVSGIPQPDVPPSLIMP